MILPDYQIEELCDSYDEPLISPFTRANLQPASVDLTLANDFTRISIKPGPSIDLGNIEKSTRLLYSKSQVAEGMQLEPGEFALGRTVERVSLPDYIVGRVEGKSSLGRLGLLVHATAGFIDPGFRGTITLELYNLNFRPIILRPNKRICQISFTEMLGAAAKPYGSEGLGSRYQDQVETTPSRYTD